MCVQCMAAAMGAGAGATGVRSYLGTRSWAWLTPHRLRRATQALLGAALVAASFGLG